jgi:hypothetical protein
MQEPTTLARRHRAKLSNDLIEARRTTVLRFAGQTSAGITVRNGFAVLVFRDNSALRVELTGELELSDTRGARRFQSFLSYWLLFVFSLVLAGMTLYVLYNAFPLCVDGQTVRGLQ